MRMVIDMDEDEYQRTMQHYEQFPRDLSRYERRIIDGTPLPKGHGRLVDMSEVIVKLMQYYDREKTIGQCLDEVHTVIEADGGSEE